MRNRPNIVFLLNDHQPYYRHGWDGGPGVQRPNFARLASEGLAFGRSYTACPLCGPARRSMLTGLLPHNHGELKNDTNHIYDRQVYLDLLSEAGYQNYYYGKWHAGPGTALDHHCSGFSYPSYNNPYTKPEYLTYLETHGLPDPEIKIERCFWPPVLWNGKTNPMVEGKTYRQDKAWCNEHASGVMLTPTETHEAFFLADMAVGKLRELARSSDGKPFSLRVDFWGPHQPYFPTQEYCDLYNADDIPEYGNFSDDLSEKPESYRGEKNYPLSRNGELIVPNALPWNEWQKVLARAYAQITLVDAAGGLILDALDDLGLFENTLVVWTTDHGDGLACHGGHFDKQSYLPEEMMRVPLAMRWPGNIPAGRMSDALVSNIDLAPSFLEAAGEEFTNPVDGESLLPLAKGDKTEWRQDLMCETHGHMEDHIGRLVVSDRHKYVANAGQVNELYDLRDDPFELANLMHNTEYAGVLTDMKRRLERWQDKTHDPVR